MMPPMPESGPRQPAIQVPGAGVDQPRLGSMFTVALLKAGRDGCNCESCQMLKRIVDEMERQIGVDSGAGTG